MRIDKVYVINDLFTVNDKEMFEEFRGEYLRKYDSAAYYFVVDGTKDYKDQVKEAVNNAIDGKYDLVLLDIYFGEKRVSSNRLGIDVALPMLAAHGLPVILWSGLINPAQENQNILDAQKIANAKYLPHDQLELLPGFIDSMICSSIENKASKTFGFKPRHQDDIDKREQVKNIFDVLCRADNSSLIEVPLAAPVSNFLGPSHRPLPEKHSQKLFSCITTDGMPLAIRYEGTMLVAKQIADDILHLQSFATRCYHYFQEMLRVEYSSDLDSTHYRSFYQAGLECFTVKEDQRFHLLVQTLSLVKRFIAKCGSNVTLRLSHLDLLQKPLKSLEKSDMFLKRKIIGVLEKGDLHEIELLLKMSGLGDYEKTLLISLADARESNLSEGLALLRSYESYYGQLVDHFSNVVELLSSAQLVDNCKFDPGINRSLGFYSGFTFQGDVPGMKECLGGGEFTGLVESFGAPGPVFSVGMAIGVERLIDAVRS